MARDDNKKTDRELIQEIADRARRTETRTTKIAEHLGIDAGGQKAVFNLDGYIEVPHPKTSLDEIIAVVPEGLKGHDIDVYCGEELLTSINV